MEVLCPSIIKEYNSHMNWVDIHDQLKATNKTDWKSRFRYYLSVLFFNTNSDPVNAHIIYKKKVNAKMSLFHFKFILAEFLINKFFSQKRKFTSKEPQPALELPLALKEPAHTVQFTEKHRRCMYCFNTGNKDTSFCNVSLCIQMSRSCFKF